MQDLCNHGAVTLQNKSTQVEEAANELINMLMSYDDEKEDEEDDEEEEKEKDVTEESKTNKMGKTWFSYTWLLS